MRPVQFSRDVRREATTTQPCRSKFRVRSGGKKCAAECEEDFDLTVVHRADRLDRVVPVIARRLEVEYFAELVEKRFGRSFPDADSAIALHVAVPAHGTHTRARFSNLPAQQHQVYDLLNVRYRVLVLRESHGPTADRALRLDEDLRRRFDLYTRHATLLDDLVPRNILQCCHELIEPGRVRVDELAIERTVTRKHRFRDSFKQR